MKKLFVLALVLFAGAAVFAEEEAPDPKALFEKTDAAIKQVSAVSYKAEATPTGVATNFVSATSGDAVFTGWNGQLPEKFKVHVQTTMQGSDDPVELTGGGDGEMFFLIDHTNKKGYEDMDPGVMGSSAGSLQFLAMMEFVHTAPFDDELGSESLEYQGTEEIGGVLCHKIFVQYDEQQSSTWFLADEDGLPRGRTRYFKFQGQEGTVDVKLMDLNTSPALDDATFRMELPEGFEKIDDFAP